MNRHSADLVGAPVEPTRLVARDLASEVIAAIVAKPGRSFLTTLGTVLGVGTLIVILGLTSTASGQVSARFDAQAATTVTVKDARDPEGGAPFPFTAEAIARARALNGVTGAGVIYAPTTDDQVASAHPEHTTPTTLPVIAVSPTAWDAIGPALSAGRLYDAFAEHQPVVVLGRAEAGRLGVTGEGPQRPSRSAADPSSSPESSTTSNAAPTSSSPFSCPPAPPKTSGAHPRPSPKPNC